MVPSPVTSTAISPCGASPLGPAALSELPRRDTHSCDVFAIGGVDEERLLDLDPYRDRISGVAAIRLFQESGDPRAVAERIAAR